MRFIWLKFIELERITKIRTHYTHIYSHSVFICYAVGYSGFFGGNFHVLIELFWSIVDCRDISGIISEFQWNKSNEKCGENWKKENTHNSESPVNRSVFSKRILPWSLRQRYTRMKEKKQLWCIYELYVMKCMACASIFNGEKMRLLRQHIFQHFGANNWFS